MQNSKLIQLLKTFSTMELREYGKWIESPFFNRNKELISLYKYLRKHAPDFPSKKIERETVYKLLFGKKAFDEKRFNHLVSLLLKSVEQYISYNQYAANPILKNIHLLNSYKDRGLSKHFNYIYDQTKAKLDSYPHRNLDFYYLQYLLSETDNMNFLRQKIRKYDVRLQKAADYFDLYLVANKLRYFCEMTDRKMSLAADYKLNMDEEIETYVSRQELSAHPGIKAYLLILQMLKNPDEAKHFHQLKKLIKNNDNTFPKNELQELYFYTINYCIRKVNNGEQEFWKEIFKIYKEALKSELLLEDKQLSPWTYKNMVAVALRLNEFEWSEKFIHKYNAFLAEEFRNNALYYNLAELYYYQHDFDKAMSYLNKVEFSDIYYSFDTKKMMVKIFFEKDEIDALLSLITSFRVFIKRNQSVSDTNKQAYENFISVINQFLKYRQKDTAPELLENIQNLKPLADRNWLLEQYRKRWK
ncbi:MAG: hypothetical protein WD048_03570 [Chitinophagales bacterium]